MSKTVREHFLAIGAIEPDGMEFDSVSGVVEIEVADKVLATGGDASDYVESGLLWLKRRLKESGFFGDLPTVVLGDEADRLLRQVNRLAGIRFPDDRPAFELSDSEANRTPIRTIPMGWGEGAFEMDCRLSSSKKTWEEMSSYRVNLVASDRLIALQEELKRKSSFGEIAQLVLDEPVADIWDLAKHMLAHADIASESDFFDAVKLRFGDVYEERFHDLVSSEVNELALLAEQPAGNDFKRQGVCPSL